MFTPEQDAFILMAHFRSGTQNEDGSWTYSLQNCIEQFKTAFPDTDISHDEFLKRRHYVLHGFNSMQCICKEHSPGDITTLAEENILFLESSNNDSLLNSVEEKTNTISPTIKQEPNDVEIDQNDSDQQTTDGKSDSADKPAQCHLCKKRYANSYGLKVHMKLHSGYTPHKCTKCDKTFYQSSNLRCHMLTHTEKTFICEICPRKFHFEKQLQKHVDEHSNQTWYECKECSKKFRKEASLTKHELIHLKNKLPKQKRSKYSEKEENNVKLDLLNDKQLPKAKIKDEIDTDEEIEKPEENDEETETIMPFETVDIKTEPVEGSSEDEEITTTEHFTNFTSIQPKLEVEDDNSPNC